MTAHPPPAISQLFLSPSAESLQPATPLSTMFKFTPPKSYTLARRGRRRLNPSRQTKSHLRESMSRSIRIAHETEGMRKEGAADAIWRRRSMKIRSLYTDDANVFSPLLTARRSPSVAPLNTPNSSLTPTNASRGGSGSKTTSPNPSPTASSSTGYDSSPGSSVENGEVEAEAVVVGDHPVLEEREPEEGSVLPRSIMQKEKEGETIVVVPPPPSIAKAAEIALAEVEVEAKASKEPPPSLLREDDEWINIRVTNGRGHSKAASEPTTGSVKETISKKSPPRIPSFTHSSSSSTFSPPTQQRTSPTISSSPFKSALYSSSPSPPKPRRRTSLRSSAGAFLDMLKSVSSITP
ncbi:hypothetical protein V5O48_004631 [Marasmius crinis-equi]|uniref:Uncharacterized protein n=1 Tax=Marasmius crinis-equi TaxID=585013 RepID=A0ABR3FQ97_9AGAR